MFEILLVILIHLTIWCAGIIIYLSYGQDGDGFALAFALLAILIGLSTSLAFGLNAALAITLSAPMACFAAVSSRS